MKKKVILNISDEGVDISGVSSERVWCEEVDKDIYKLSNIPFYAFGYSLADEIYAPDLSISINLENIVVYSDNSTVLILIMEPERFSLYEDFAEKMKCEFESSVDRKSFTLSVPATVNLKKVSEDLMNITNLYEDGFVIITQRHYQNDELFYS